MKRNAPFSTSQDFEDPPTIFSDVSDRFSLGSIQCIKLRNFMTFEKMTISPSPGLNLIIGPNGSGKSTIVCAIGLGLGASPNVLARASKISSFIKHSCDEAKIKILLTGNPSFWVCRRIGADNTTQWQIRFLNGKWKQTSSADVLQRIQALHIQLDNLCMFLPQERVKEFSALKPNQLLLETEKAINHEAYEIHQCLIRDFHRQKDMIQQMNDLKNKLEKYESSLQQMQGDVERLKQIESFKEKIEQYEKKIPWIQFQNEKEELRALKKELHQEVLLYKESKQSIAPLEEEIRQLKRQKSSSGKAKENFNNIKDSYISSSKELFQLEQKYQSNKNKLSLIKKDKEDNQKNIQKLNVVLEHTSRKINSADSMSMEELNEKRKSLQKKMQQINVDVTEIRTRKEEIERKVKRKNQRAGEINSKIQAFQNQKNRLLRHIEQHLRRADVVQVYKYIKDNKSMFLGEVYGPICIEVSFDDPRNANILQMVVENHILYSFLVMEKSDFNQIIHYLQENDLNQITVLRAGNQDLIHSQRRTPPNLEKYGFPKYVDQLFQAPEAVKEMLVNIAGLNLIPVGRGKEAQNNIDYLTENVFRMNSINRYFINDLFYRIYLPRGKGRQTISSVPTRPSNIWRETLSSSEDIKNLTEKLNSIKDKISNYKNQISETEDEIKGFNKEQSDIANQLKDIKSKIQEKNAMESKLKQVSEKIKALTDDLKKLDKKEQQYPKLMVDYVTKKFKIIQKNTQILEKLIEAGKELDKITSKDVTVNLKLQELEERLEQERQNYHLQEKRLLELNEEKTRKKAQVDRLQKEAQKKCPLTDENKKMLAELPADLDILNSELTRAKARYASISQIDPTVATRFAQTEKDRDSTQDQYNQIKQNFEILFPQIESRFNEWKQSVSNNVKIINDAFQKLMETCEYRGEVQLDYDDKDRIETYKLNILVAFNRVSKLNVLSSTRQSGGEKSVTTLLYLLALQDCTRFPFRVVDEINQGMDEINDRNTFFQVMSYTVRRNQASQYFLVTPKLLPQLDLMDGVTVLVVMNGPYIQDYLTKPITFQSALSHDSQSLVD